MSHETCNKGTTATHLLGAVVPILAGAASEEPWPELRLPPPASRTGMRELALGDKHISGHTHTAFVRWVVGLLHHLDERTAFCVAEEEKVLYDIPAEGASDAESGPAVRRDDADGRWVGRVDEVDAHEGTVHGCATGAREDEVPGGVGAPESYLAAVLHGRVGEDAEGRALSIGIGGHDEWC